MVDVFLEFDVLFMDSLRVSVSGVPGIFIYPTGPLMGEATYIMMGVRLVLSHVVGGAYM